MREIKKTKIIVLCIYLLTVLWFTIFNRSVRPSSAQTDLFWSYKAWINDQNNQIGQEILANIVMFMPFGFLLSSIVTKHRLVFPAAILFSLIIETLQLFLMRGLFEWDDVVSNTIGAIMGIGLFLIFDKYINEKHRAIIMKSLATFILIACAVIVVRGHGKVEVNNTNI